VPFLVQNIVLELQFYPVSIIPYTSKLEFINATSTLNSLDIDGVAKQIIQTTICTRELVNRQEYFDSHNVASSFVQNFYVRSCVAQTVNSAYHVFYCHFLHNSGS